MTTEIVDRVQDRFVTLNGLKFHYREWGDPASPPLVILHGVTGHGRSWDRTCRAFQDRYHIFALDQRGHGESEWADDYAPERRIEDLEAFVEQMGWAKFTLVGLSMGGMCASGYAIKHSDRLEKLVIVDITPTRETAGSTRIGAGMRQRDVFDSVEEAVAQGIAANPRAPEAEVRHRFTHNLKQTADGKWTWRYDAAIRQAPRVPMAPEEVELQWTALLNISCPTLMIRGGESDLTSLASAERFAVTVRDGRAVEVTGAGHSVPLDNPEGFIEALEAFL
jgi:esterase